MKLWARFCIAFIVLCISAAVTYADDAKAVFDSLYGGKYKLAQQTPSTADDVALAKELLEAAKSAGSTPEFQQLLCDRAYDLAWKDPAGYDTAIAAKQLDAQVHPDHAPAALEAVAAVQQHRYNSARGADKNQAGETLIDALLAVAAAKAGEPDGGAAALRKAQGIATSIKSPRAAQIKATLDGAADRKKTADRIAELKAKLKADPADKAAGRELVTIYALSLDRPEEARQYTFLCDDADLTSHVALASTDPASLQEAQCLDLAEWYKKQADAAASSVRPALLIRTHGYYTRYLEHHTTEDLARTKATLTLKTIKQSMDAMKIDVKAMPTPTVTARPPTTLPKAQSVTATWTAPDKDEGIAFFRHGDSNYTNVKVGGKDAVKTSMYLYFNIDDKFVFDLPRDAEERVFLRLSAWDEIPTNTSIIYDGYAPPLPADQTRWRHPAMGMSLTGTGQWVERTIELTNPRLAGGLHLKTDIRLDPNSANGVPPIGKITIERMKLRPLLERTLRTANVVDLLPLVDLDHDVMSGEWKRDGAALVSDSNRGPRLMLPIATADEYQLDVRLTRITGNGGFYLTLPTGTTRVTLCLDGYASVFCGLNAIGGADYKANVTTQPGHRLTNGTPANLHIIVTPHGSDVTIKTELDGKPFIQWTGAQSLLSSSSAPITAAIHLSTPDSSYRYDAIKFKVLGGTAVLLH